MIKKEFISASVALLVAIWFSAADAASGTSPAAPAAGSDPAGATPGQSGTSQPAASEPDLEDILGASPPAAPAAPAGTSKPPDAKIVQPIGSGVGGAGESQAGTSKPSDAKTVQSTGNEASGTEASDSTTAVIPLDKSSVGHTVAHSGNSTNRVVEEIVVTAQRREENIQDVPISIQAFSGGALEARGIDKTTQLGESIPSLQFTEVEGFSIIYLRGLGTDIFIPSADPSVATYIDGVYIPQGTQTANSLGGVKRVEVLKGPQGTLFGRNVTGGAINVTTEDPGSSFNASASAEKGSFDHREFKASVSGPITDWLSAGVWGVISDERSYYTDKFYEPLPTNLHAVRAKLNFHPTDDITLALTGYTSQQEGVSSTIGNNVDPTPLGKLLGIKAQPDTYSSNYNDPVGGTGSQHILYGSFTWNGPSFDVKMLGADELIKGSSHADFDGSNLPLVDFDAANTFATVKSGEFQLLSNDSTWASNTWKWILGYYYYQGAGGFLPGQARVAPNVITTLSNPQQTGLDLTIPQGLLNLFNEFPAIPGGSQGLTIQFYGNLGTISHSLYTQHTIKFADWVDVTLGGRYGYERRQLLESSTALVNPLTNDPETIFTWPRPISKQYTFTPKGVLSFHLGEDDRQLLYLSYTKGYKGATYNVATLYTPPSYVAPEEVQAYEVGTKLQFFDGALRLNADAFWNHIKNLQVDFISLQSGGAVTFFTAPAAHSRGAEFDSTWLPLPTFDQGLAITSNAAYLDAAFTKFENGQGFDPVTGLYEANLNFDGNRIPRTARWSGSLGVVQSFNLFGGVFEVGVDDYYNSGFFFDSQNSVKQSKYSVLNTRVSYLYTPWNVRLTAFAQNLLDKKYHLQEFKDDFGVDSTLAAPREIGLRLNWNF